MTDAIRLGEVKRIEGHGRISLYLDDAGTVSDAHFEVEEFRGFEKMVEGRMVWEMPLITSRVCGVCPVSHHLAAVKAVEAIYGTEVPPAARLLRELLHLGAFSQDHALHFFFLAGPDFLTGDGNGSRDILGIIGAKPELAMKAIGLRKVGQHIVKVVGGRASHPVSAIPGGMSKGITAEERDEIRTTVKDSLDDAIMAEEVAHDATTRLLEENQGYAVAPMRFMAQMGERGAFDLYDGTILVAGPGGEIEEEFPASEYADHIGEGVRGHSYAKSPYLLAHGESEGVYRVGPLSRVNLASSMPGPRSEEALARFRAELGRPVHATLAYHWARMIELVASYERMLTLLDDDMLLSSDLRVKIERGPGEGAAAIEAPRGTLIHHYEADAVGRVTKANLVVATTHNTNSLDRAVLDAVKGAEKEKAISDDTVRRMEMGIRAHDPCLSCATHEVGRMPLVVEIVDANGVVVAERGAR